MMVLSERLFPKVNKVTISEAADISDLEKLDVGPPFSIEAEIRPETKPLLDEISESSEGTTRNVATVFGNFRAIIHFIIFSSIILLVLFLLKS